MAVARATDWHGDSPDLLVANTTWDRLLIALQTSGEQFSVQGGNTNPWWWWLHERVSAKTWPLLGGEHLSRAYLLAQSMGPGATADRIAALAAAIGDVVLGYTYDDKTGSEQIVVARGPQLLRFVVTTGWANHSEGQLLEGEAEGTPGILRGLGFDPNAWLDHGEVHRLTWTMLNPEQQADAHRRLYFGPLRMRIDYVHLAAAKGLAGAPDDWTVDK